MSVIPPGEVHGTSFIDRVIPGRSAYYPIWSPEGRWLAGGLHPPGGRQAPGVVLYSLAGKDYVPVSADNGVLYLVRNTEEGDIWLLTMK